MQDKITELITLVTDSESLNDSENRHKLKDGLLRVRESIQKAETVHTFLIENIQDVVWVLDLESERFTYVSPSVFKLRGYTAEEVMQQSMRDAITPESAKRLLEVLPERLRQFHSNPGDQVIKIDEVDQPRKDGTIVHTEVQSSYRINPENGKIEIIGVSRDITRRKQAEKIQKSEETRYLSILNTVPDTIYVADKDTYEILFANQAVISDVGEDPVGRKCYEVFQKRNSPCDFCTNPIIFIQDGPYEWEYYNPIFKKYLYCMDRAMKWHDGRDVRFEIAVDITPIKEAEQELRKLSTILQQSPVTIVITDTNGTIQYVNPAFKKQTGYASSEVIGKNPRILKSGKTPEETYPLMWRTIKEGRVWEGTFINKKKNGKEYWESAVISPVKDESGTVVNFLGVKQDITELKQTELLLRDANATKNKFFSIIAHDLRSPFTALLNLSDILSESGESMSPKERTELSKNINESAKNTYGLLNNLLVWARTQSGNIPYLPDYIDIKKNVEEVIALFKDNLGMKNLSVDLTVSGDCRAYADLDMFSAIFRNLLSNAIKFTPPYGKITISARELKGHVIFSVSDTGIGIPEEHISHLFHIDVHYSTEGTDEESGTGLGLILCKEFVEKHGGTISVESAFGKGSTFTFTLPQGPDTIDEH